MKLWLAFFLSAAAAAAQPIQAQINADCVIAFTISSVNGTGPVSGSYDNRQTGCNSWQLSYGLTLGSSFSAVTLAVQSATDAATFGTMGGTVTFGTNPLTSTTGASNLIQAYGTGFSPFVRVQATTLTGTGSITGVLLGYRAAGAAGTSTTLSTTITAPLGQNPMSAGVSVTLPNNQTNGCTPTFVNLSGSGNTQLVAASGALNVYICDLEFSTGTPEDFKLTQGTGANCGVGTADATALNKNISAWSLTPGGGMTASKVTTTNGNGLCANQANAQAAGVTLWYLQQ